MIGRIQETDWWAALFLVLFDTGERIGAVMELTWENVDMSAGWLTIPAEVRKGRTRDIVARLHPETVARLDALRPRGQKIFPWPYCKTLLWYHLGRVLKAAGLPHDQRSKFHRMRRTVASYFELAGGNATELLDHSSRKVTRAYLDGRIIERKHPADMIPRPAQSAIITINHESTDGAA